MHLATLHIRRLHITMEKCSIWQLYHFEDKFIGEKLYYIKDKHSNQTTNILIYLLYLF